MHHGYAHGSLGVEPSLYVDKGGVHSVQLLDKAREIPDVAADTVKAVHHDIIERLFSRALHHQAELRMVEVFRRKTSSSYANISPSLASGMFLSMYSRHRVI